MPSFKNHPFFIKLFHWEYWPMYFLYVPVVIQHLWLSVKAQNPFFFLSANPAIDEGFILSDSKYRTLKLVPENHRPLSIYVAENEKIEVILEKVQENKLSYPLILKPDIGYRGLLVKKLNNKKELITYAQNLRVPHIIQEYINTSFEIGIFYYRLPGSQKGKIPSITIKEFLSVSGNGKNTLAELVFQNPRAILQKEKLKAKFSASWNRIIEKDKKIVLEHIGNHNRGTMFVNGAGLNDENLLNVFEKLNREMKGFYFGRFDIRANSLEDIKKGGDFKILEVNGVGAEPTHIYDPSYKILKAWKELLFLWRIVFKIASLHKKSGIPYVKWSEGVSRFKCYLKYTRKLS